MSSPRENIERLYDLKHKLMVMRHAVEPLIEVVHKLYGGRVPQVCVGVQDYFRDVYDHLLRVSQQLDGLRDMVITAMSVNLSMITLHEGEVTKRLAAYAALVAVPTMIAGIYGMNFQHMPELHWAWGYPVGGRDHVRNRRRCSTGASARSAGSSGPRPMRFTRARARPRRAASSRKSDTVPASRALSGVTR